FSTSPVDLTSLDPVDHPELRAVATLTAGAGVESPVLTSVAFEVKAFEDVTPPVIVPHADVVAEATHWWYPTQVIYEPPLAADDVDPPHAATCVPAPWAPFPLGSTLVTCTASDAAGNPATPTTFQVHVADTAPPTV